MGEARGSCRLFAAECGGDLLEGRGRSASRPGTLQQATAAVRPLAGAGAAAGAPGPPAPEPGTAVPGGWRPDPVGKLNCNSSAFKIN